MVELFINQKPVADEKILELFAGFIYLHKGVYGIEQEQYGARDTFSIGQPVYDKENNLMGHLEIHVYDTLHYYAEGENLKENIPVEYWAVGNPTEHCKEGKRVFTYWQNCFM
jgi:hypothetical protein